VATTDDFGFRYNNIGTGTLALSNISLKEVLMGNHATTNFFGDDLLEGYGDFSDASKWSGVDNGFSITGNKLVGSSATGNIYRDVPTSVGTLTNGKSYEVTFTVSNYSSGDIKFILGGNDNGTARTANGTYTETIIITNRVNNFVYLSTSGCTLDVDDITVKEVGISSSGFDTAVNEPVVPQIPLMRYNQKMITSSDVSTNTYVHLPDGLTKGLTEITISLWFQKIKSGNSLVTLFAVDGGGTYFRDTGNNRITCHMPFDNGGNPFTNFAFPSDLAPHHYVFTVKSGSQEVYRDGVLVHSTTVTTTTMSHNIRRIGNYAGSQDNSMADEFAIFNKHFTQAEAQELFNDGLAYDATTHSKKGNLFGYWRNDGVTTWKDRKGWSYLDFVTNDYLQTASAVDAFGTNPFSFSIWINQHNTVQSGMFSNGQWNSSQDWFFASIKSGGSGLLGIGTYSAWKHRFDTALVQTNKWHLVTYVREGTGTNQSKWYLDGALVDTATDATDWKAGSYLNIGSYITDSGFLDGQISQLAIYHNKALSASEVSEQFSNGISSKFTTSGATHHFVMDNGTTIVDLVGGNNATNYGATYVSGDSTVQGSPDSITIREGLNTNRDGLGFYFTNPSNNVLRLNGVDEFLEIDDSDVFSFGDSVGDLPFTISAWIKPRGTSALFRILDKSTSSSVVEYNLSIDSSNKCTLALYDSSTSHLIFRPSSSSIVADQWTFVTATYNGSGANSGINIYINDALNNGTASSSGSYTAMHNTTSTLKIGIRKFDDSFGNGLIDELRIYNKELSLAEIQKNYKHQKGKHKND